MANKKTNRIDFDSPEKIFYLEIGRIDAQSEKISLGVRDLCDIMIHNFTAQRLKLGKSGFYGVTKNTKYVIKKVNVSFCSLILYKYDVVLEVYMKSTKIKDATIQDYLAGKMFGYGTAEIDQHNNEVTKKGLSHCKAK